jgi:hypothetical protein
MEVCRSGGSALPVGESNQSADFRQRLGEISVRAVVARRGIDTRAAVAGFELPPRYSTSLPLQARELNNTVCIENGIT